MTLGDRAQQVLRWLAARSPRQIVVAGWIVFVLGSYPGYMSKDSATQLFTVRSGDYTDYSPVMTALWGAFEYVFSGPFPMLLLQSGLFLAARVADRVLTVDDTYQWQQQLMVADTVGIVRRSKLKQVDAMIEAFSGIPLADSSTLKERVTASADALNWRPLSNGDKRIFELITTDDQAEALSADWRHQIMKRPKSYLLHR